MGKKDDRDETERAAWDAGQITKDEAAAAGRSVEEMNKIREDEERAAGNPLAPPE